jgi:hypothetical protein
MTWPRAAGSECNICINNMRTYIWGQSFIHDPQFEWPIHVIFQMGVSAGIFLMLNLNFCRTIWWFITDVFQTFYKSETFARWHHYLSASLTESSTVVPLLLLSLKVTSPLLWRPSTVTHRTTRRGGAASTNSIRANHITYRSFPRNLFRYSTTMSYRISPANLLVQNMVHMQMQETCSYCHWACVMCESKPQNQQYYKSTETAD